MSRPDIYQKLDRAKEIELIVKNRNPAMISLGLYGLYMKAILYIYFR
jgi:hypothetical protein